MKDPNQLLENWKQHKFYQTFKDWMGDEFKGQPQRLKVLLESVDTIVGIAQKAQEAKTREEYEVEMIIGSAVITKDGHIFCGKRHSDCLKAIHEAGLKPGEEKYDQGFMTSKSRYVNRYEAFKIQKRNGIESKAPEGYEGEQLYSEDLY